MFTIINRYCAITKWIAQFKDLKNFLEKYHKYIDAEMLNLYGQK